MSFKRQKVLAALIRAGLVILRDTGPHTIVGKAGAGGGARASVPRHRELDRHTVRAITKDLGLDWDEFQKEVR